MGFKTRKDKTFIFFTFHAKQIWQVFKINRQYGIVSIFNIHYVVYHFDVYEMHSPCPVTSRRGIIEANKNKHNIPADIFSFILCCAFMFYTPQY